MTSEALNQEILQVSSQLLEKAVWRSRSRNGRVKLPDSLQSASTAAKPMPRRQFK